VGVFFLQSKGPGEPKPRGRPKNASKVSKPAAKKTLKKKQEDSDDDDEDEESLEAILGGGGKKGGKGKKGGVRCGKRGPAKATSLEDLDEGGLYRLGVASSSSGQHHHPPFLGLPLSCSPLTFLCFLFCLADKFNLLYEYMIREVPVEKLLDDLINKFNDESQDEVGV